LIHFHTMLRALSFFLSFVALSISTSFG
jgi:hypothetical protein